MIVLFQHGPGEPPGYIREILLEQSIRHTVIPLYETGEVPGDTEATHLVFLGGQMSANDEVKYPWLSEEKRLIRRAVSEGTPVLGICLGAQLIASAFGKKVYPCRPERGWFKIRRSVRSETPLPSENPVVFQWHGETFDLPDGSVLLYRGDQVENQMFSFGSATGVQFHPEVTEKIIAKWCRDEGKKGTDIAMPGTSRFITGSQQVCRSVFTMFLEGAAT